MSLVYSLRYSHKGTVFFDTANLSIISTSTIVNSSTTLPKIYETTKLDGQELQESEMTTETQSSLDIKALSIALSFGLAVIFVSVLVIYASEKRKKSIETDEDLKQYLIPSETDKKEAFRDLEVRISRFRQSLNYENAPKLQDGE